MSLDSRFAEAMGQLLGPDFPTDIALAVSGGGDSMAMLTLAHNWSHRWGVRLHVVTIDHGLRAGSAAEAQMVADECKALGWPHTTLRWHWDGQGNVMDAARRARLDLIDRWRGVLCHVLMAHTADDVAETFVMRLMRGSGVEGLSAMAEARTVRMTGVRSAVPAADITGPLPSQGNPAKGVLTRPGSFHILRPCLGMRRDELRHYLKTLKGRWVEDPTNEDPRYARSRVRQFLQGGDWDIENLISTAQHMERASAALRARAIDVHKTLVADLGQTSALTGDILWDRATFETVERDTQLRLLAGALQFVSSAEYRPRFDPLEDLLDRVLAGGGGTLHGCEARAERDVIRVWREYAAVRDLTTEVGDGTLWDGRWRVFDSALRGASVRALGEDGWAQIKEKPKAAPPFHAARSLPAIWQDDQVMACDALGVGSGFTASLWPMGRELFSFKAFLSGQS
ncbi:tRNA lysidine(34) synthetase TilS [Thalassococcus lentus]|uniref:tRNA(Ile)-lysidine synthase n=1 Tax=Thalassococcus lentus TaxID=1210524 RepID=A0ABT4XTA8_9RHOB|nr:tRNA lysidine(34) synthetase TilS [Thalassococcus lentus]MDA7425196.1 tRNA lysidine(34) synthetase TilS [Thalassococcus lentus]